MDIAQNLWIPLFLPLLAVLFIIIPSAYISFPKKRITFGLTLLSPVVSLILSLFFIHYLLHHPTETLEVNFIFLNSGAFKVHIGAFMDKISAFAFFVFNVIALCSGLFAYKYMQDKEDFSRFFILLNLFVFSMSGLILSANLIQFYIFWELCGVFSYLLIGFYYKRPASELAAKKSFLINKIGDFALLAAVLVFSYFLIQDTDAIFYPLLTLNDVSTWSLMAYVQLGAFAYSVLCLLVVFAAMVKSAQFPFQVWLVDAMEAPTPANALIHGALITSAGAYLIIRLYPALILSPVVLKTIAVIGIITAISCAVIAIAQNDIKKILAFSTASQLGLVFTALGCGAYSGAVFQLGAHALAKTLMFITAGVILHKTLNRNLKFLGGLREYMPILAAAWLIGVLSLSGVFFSGFYSKEMILNHLWESRQFVFLGLSAFAVILNVIYLFRSYFIIFEGHYKGSYDFSQDEDKKYDGIDRFMLSSLGVSALLTAFLGGFIAADFQRHIYIIKQKFYLVRHPELEISIFIASVLTIYLMWQIYAVRKFKIRRVRLIYRFVVLQFYLNKIFELLYNVFIGGLSKVVRVLDKYVIGGIYTLIMQIARFGGYLISRLQNGNLNSYIFYSFVFVAAVLLCAVMVYFKGLSQYGG